MTGTFCDPAGNQANGSTGMSLIADLRKNGIRATSKGSKILDGLEWIRRKLRAGDGTSRLVISPKCEKLIEAMQCYHYPQGVQGDRAELPVKDGVYDHPIDALRYFFANMEKSSKVEKKRF